MAHKRSTDNHDFDEFWARYPRCINKDGAKASYLRAIARGANPAAIKAGLEAYPFSGDAAMIPHPTTWLNQRRWEGYTLRQPPSLMVQPDRSSWMNKYDGGLAITVATRLPWTLNTTGPFALPIPHGFKPLVDDGPTIDGTAEEEQSEGRSP